MNRSELVLAAIDRAERHSRQPDQPGVPRSAIAAHLGPPHSSWTTRRIRPVLESLEAEGLIKELRRHGYTLWTLTSKGRRRLAAARRSGRATLPESPQHRAWREAREEARTQIHGLREDLRTQLQQADHLLTIESAASDTWTEIGQDPRDACVRLGSAIQCLYEWSEPN